MRGWHRESYKHSLAARGYCSKKYDYAIKYAPVKSSKYDMVLVGTDRKGRRVRKYDDDHWKEASKEKFARVLALKKEYPEIIGEVKRDMHSEDPNVRKNARVTYIIAKTGIRPGTRKDMKADQESYGATTLKKEHVVVSGDKVKFNFTGKHGIPIKLEESDPVLAKAITDEKREVPGAELFPHTSDATVRNYLEKFGDYKSKDFRTLKANHIAEKMVKAGVPKQAVTEAVAKKLANTPSVSENSYIDPKVWKNERRV